MTIRPILFSAPMIRALLAGRKTQTRRLKFKAEPGDLLWVKETWAHVANFPPTARYYATDDVHELRKKRPSIFMPRWASRLTLQVTEVQLERLHDISCDDAVVEGIYAMADVGDDPAHLVWTWADDATRHETPRAAYAALWDEINGERPGASWADNPIATVITFLVHKCNVEAETWTRASASAA